MADDSLLRSLAELVAARKTVLAADESWANYDDAATSEAFERLETLQSALLGADFSRPDHRLIALDLLLDGDDHPNFADDFKNGLFSVLQTLLSNGDKS